MPSLVLRSGQPFSLDATLGCGQVFRWSRNDDGTWRGVVAGRALACRQEGRRLTFSGADRAYITRYFALDLDLCAIVDSFDCDPFILTAIRRCPGLRIIRQPPFECLISYICSTNSNIPTIRARIAAIARRFGMPVAGAGGALHGFPGPGELSSEGPDSVAECRLGYRAPYVYSTACCIGDETAWEKRIRSLPFEEARRELMTLSGIGPKAADCVLLFAFQQYEAFPVDVWIRRIMHQHYIPDLPAKSSLSAREYDRIRRFAREHFGPYCGYAQEYLYAGREG